MTKRIVTKYEMPIGLTTPLTIGVVSDLHNDDYDGIFETFKNVDAIFVPGDICNRYKQTYEKGIQFLHDASARFPTFYSLGNHEIRLKDYYAFIREVKKTNAVFLRNTYVKFGELWIGGFYKHNPQKNAGMLKRFSNEEGPKVLLCHKPNDYPIIKPYNIPCIISGHAHGGQFRLFNRGLYAPDQGFFPKLTKGIVDNRLIISTGASNPSSCPRFNNPCEIILLTLT